MGCDLQTTNRCRRMLPEVIMIMTMIMELDEKNRKSQEMFVPSQDLGI